MKGLPLKVLARLADVGTVVALQKVLAAAEFPLADLLMEFHDNAYGPWRVSLVAELARRGARKVLIDAEDPLGTTYNRLLGAMQGGVAATLEVARRWLSTGTQTAHAPHESARVSAIRFNLVATARHLLDTPRVLLGHTVQSHRNVVAKWLLIPSPPRTVSEHLRFDLSTRSDAADLT